MVGWPLAQHQVQPVRINWIVARIPRREAVNMKEKSPIVAPMAMAKVSPHLQQQADESPDESPRILHV